MHADFQSFAEQNDQAALLLAEWHDLQEAMDIPIVEPREEMDIRFSDFLHREKLKENVSEKSWLAKVFGSWNFKHSNPIATFSIISCVLLIGFLVGKYWNVQETEDAIVNTKIENSKRDTDNVREQLVISLADQPSASKRLQAVSESKKLENATNKVIVALFKMLNTDTNINVRLAAVTSLSKYADNPKVREGLILSITKQESPLVQIALADLMVSLKELKSIDSMETLLEKPDIDASVKQKIEESIRQII
jgi:hypothetical protein